MILKLVINEILNEVKTSLTYIDIMRIFHFLIFQGMIFTFFNYLIY